MPELLLCSQVSGVQCFLVPSAQKSIWNCGRIESSALFEVVLAKLMQSLFIPRLKTAGTCPCALCHCPAVHRAAVCRPSALNSPCVWKSNLTLFGEDLTLPAAKCPELKSVAQATARKTAPERSGTKRSRVRSQGRWDCEPTFRVCP